ncbi:MAG: hypothetical protein QXH42_02695, partial [Thermoplasmata archaeon]
MPAETIAKRIGTLVIALLMLGAVPWPVPAERVEDAATPRAITDNANDLIIPEGESYELSGCHTYKRSVQINGTLKLRPWDGVDESTGMIWLEAPWIIIGPSGVIAADGRGYGGGGGATENEGNGGKGGVGGKGGNGDSGYTWGGGGGGGSNGGLGGAAGSYGTAGTAGTETKGGDGGQSTYVSYP